MRFKFTVFLLVLNLISFGLIFFLKNQDTRSSEDSNRLASLIGREIIEADRIELSGPQLETPRVLIREGADWLISEPIQWSANYFAVNRILNQLQFLEEQATFSVDEIERTGQSLEDYGLSDASSVLTIGHGTERTDLVIGNRTEIGKNVYILGPNKERIFVVSNEVIDSMLVDISDLRNREIFDIPVFEVDALSVQINASSDGEFSDLSLHLKRTNNGWLFEAPLSAEADSGLVSNTINTLTSAKVESFVESQDPVILGLESPTMRITLHGNKRRQTLLLGNRVPSSKESATYFAQIENNPTVFTVSADSFDQLREAQSSLRERSFISFDPNELTAIRIKEGDLTVRLNRLETGSWQVIQPKGDNEVKAHRVEDSIIHNLVTDLYHLRAKDFASDEPTPSTIGQLGFNNPRRTVTLSFGEGVDPIVLELAHPNNDNENLYARTKNSDYIYLVERRATLDMFPLNELHYWKRVLGQLPKSAQIKAVRLKRLTTETMLLDLNPAEAGASWKELIDALPEDDRLALGIVLKWIREFRVDAYRADYFEEAYPLDANTELPWVYRLSVDISLPDGSETGQIESREYLFTERLSGTAQAGGSKAHNTMFDVDPELIEALHDLTSDLKLPEEALGEPVPTPSPYPLLQSPDETKIDPQDTGVSTPEADIETSEEGTE